METGTLKELNVKPGDVVAYLGGEEYLVCDGNKLQCPDGTVQEYRYWDSGQFSIVSRSPTPDLTAITTPFGLLDEATQEALRAHGGPYEYFMYGEWHPTDTLLPDGLVHCAKQAPRRETITMDMGMSQGGSIADFSHGHSLSVRITFDRVDGKIDLSTYKVEAR